MAVETAGGTDKGALDSSQAMQLLVAKQFGLDLGVAQATAQ